MDVVLARVVKEAIGVVRGMTIDQKEAAAPCCLLLGVRIELLDPFNADFTVDVATFRVA